MEKPVSTIVASAGLGALLGASVFVAAVFVVPSYGALLFLGAPFAMGLVTSACLDWKAPRPSQDHGNAVGAMLLGACSLLLALRLEGLICIVLALIPAAPLALLGSALGRVIAGSRHRSKWGLVSLVLLLPVLAAAEPVLRGDPLLRVDSVIEIDAPPDLVWPHVISFPELPPPTRWMFALGIAYPVRARIEGAGVGAVRYCEFSTGPFVEPITVWDPPRRLAFEVVESPAPMVETSPWGDIHPPHLDGSFASRRGEFRLVPLESGTRTRVEATTWYQLEMGPRWYWGSWTELFVGAIHDRVLEHIRAQVPSQAPGEARISVGLPTGA